MKKILILILLIAASVNSFSQILGNLVSIAPNNAPQGQTLVTTITGPAGSFTMSSPPCDNYGIRLVQGATIIYSNSFNIWWGNDILDAEFSIPAAAPTGYYDVFVSSGYYDWWTGNCQSIGDWVLYSGFVVTSTTDVGENFSSGSVSLYSDPVTGEVALGFRNADGKKHTLSVVDAFGKLIFSENTTSSKAILNRDRLAAGIYFYRLEGLDNKELWTGKFIVTD
jgi:hypothetical protein